MFSPAGDEALTMTQYRGDETADRASDVPLGIDVGVIQHGVTLAPDDAAPIGLALHEGGDHPVAIGIGQLWRR